MEILETLFSVILLIVLVLLGLLALWFGIDRSVRQSDIKRRYVDADGVVRNVSKVKDEDPGDEWPRICITLTIEHTVDGKVFSGDYVTHEVDTISERDWNYSPGDHVPIRYDPKNPTDITTAFRPEPWFDPIAILMIIIGITMLTYVVFSVVEAVS